MLEKNLNLRKIRYSEQNLPENGLALYRGSTVFPRRSVINTESYVVVLTVKILELKGSNQEK